MQLICVFVLSYAKNRFSQGSAPMFEGILEIQVHVLKEDSEMNLNYNSLHAFNLLTDKKLKYYNT